jgi:hypothetical protein
MALIRILHAALAVWLMNALSKQSLQLTARTIVDFLGYTPPIYVTLTIDTAWMLGTMYASYIVIRDIVSERHKHMW